MKIAERGTFMGKKVWVRETCPRGNGDSQTKSSHQTAILSTDYRSDPQCLEDKFDCCISGYVCQMVSGELS